MIILPHAQRGCIIVEDMKRVQSRGKRLEGSRWDREDGELNWPEVLRQCFEEDRVLYSRHARVEMRQEELGPVADEAVEERIGSGEVIESYPDDTRYPSVLVLGRTDANRPVHVVCAYAAEEDRAIVITVYPPDPERWEADYRRRRR